YHPHHLPPTHTIVDTPKGTLRDMSRPRRNSIRIGTTKESSAVIKKVTKPAKADRTLKLFFGKRFSCDFRSEKSSLALNAAQILQESLKSRAFPLCFSDRLRCWLTVDNALPSAPQIVLLITCSLCAPSNDDAAIEHRS